MALRLGGSCARAARVGRAVEDSPLLKDLKLAIGGVVSAVTESRRRMPLAGLPGTDRLYHLFQRSTIGPCEDSLLGVPSIDSLDRARQVRFHALSISAELRSRAERGLRRAGTRTAVDWIMLAQAGQTIDERVATLVERVKECEAAIRLASG